MYCQIVFQSLKFLTGKFFSKNKTEPNFQKRRIVLLLNAKRDRSLVSLGHLCSSGVPALWHLLLQFQLLCKKTTFFREIKRHPVFLGVFFFTCFSFFYSAFLTLFQLYLFRFIYYPLSSDLLSVSFLSYTFSSIFLSVMFLSLSFFLCFSSFSLFTYSFFSLVVTVIIMKIVILLYFISKYERVPQTAHGDRFLKVITTD